MVHKRFLLFILLLISIFSCCSFFSLLFFYDPYINTYFALWLLTVSFVFFMIWFWSIIWYFIKKIYLRGDVGVYNIISSMRQSFFLSIVICVMIFSMYIGLPIITPVLASFFFLLSFELLLQNTIHA